MEENIQNQETAQEQGQPQGQGSNRGFLSSILNGFSQQRQEKAKSRDRFITDVCVLIIAIGLAKYYVGGKLSRYHSSLLYQTLPAEVMEVCQFKYGEQPVENKKAAYTVTIRYYVGNSEAVHTLYYNKKPSMKEGDSIQVTVSTVDPDKIVSVESE